MFRVIHKNNPEPNESNQESIIRLSVLILVLISTGSYFYSELSELKLDDAIKTITIEINELKITDHNILPTSFTLLEEIRIHNPSNLRFEYTFNGILWINEVNISHLFIGPAIIPAKSYSDVRYSTDISGEDIFEYIRVYIENPDDFDIKIEGELVLTYKLLGYIPIKKTVSLD